MSDTLEDLYKTLQSRKGADPEKSYSAKLFAGGLPVISRKLGEEVVETAIAALTSDEDGVVNESADVLYHLLALWAHMDIEPDQIWRELERRTAQSGIEEKNSRDK
ncbi:MAG: phosphoribosyl-ATP diphosphatase [Rhodospirillaceae bacterium]